MMVTYLSDGVIIVFDISDETHANFQREKYHLQKWIREGH
jgi:hypothetical protein